MKIKLYTVIFIVFLLSIKTYSTPSFTISLGTSVNDTPVARNNWVIGSFNGVRMSPGDTIYFFVNYSDTVDINFLENDFDPDGFIDSSSVDIVYMSTKLASVSTLLPNGHLQLRGPIDYSGYMDYRVRDDSGLFSNTARVYFEVSSHSAVKNNSEKEYIKTSPNPVDKQIHLHLNGSLSEQNIHVVLMNTQGKEVLNELIPSDEYKLQVENLPNGIYFLRLSMNNMILNTSKIIIQHP